MLTRPSRTYKLDTSLHKDGPDAKMKSEHQHQSPGDPEPTKISRSFVLLSFELHQLNTTYIPKNKKQKKQDNHEQWKISIKSYRVDSELEIP